MAIGDLTILTAADVRASLDGREPEILAAVRAVFVAQARGAAAVAPRPSGLDGRAWSALAAGAEPGCDDSPLVVLHARENGHPEALLEGTLVGAKRVAASAVLAACGLGTGPGLRDMGLVGCGALHLELLRFLAHAFPGLRRLHVFDPDAGRVAAFEERASRALPSAQVCPRVDLAELLGSAALVSFATSARAPHVADLSACPKGAILLHLSQRDLRPELLPRCDNVVDDVDQACRGESSVHLAERLCRSRDFVRCTLGDVLLARVPLRRDNLSLVVYAPCGFEGLDLAVARLAYERARVGGRLTRVEGFLAPA